MATSKKTWSLRKASLLSAKARRIQPVTEHLPAANNPTQGMNHPLTDGSASHAGSQRFDSAILHNPLQSKVTDFEQLYSQLVQLNPEDLLSPEQAAIQLGGWSANKVKRYIKEGKLQGFQVKGRNGLPTWRVPKEAISAYFGLGSSPYHQQVERWVADMRSGIHYGKPLTEKTISDQNLYGLSLLWRFSGLSPGLEHFSVESFQRAMAAIPHDVEARNDHYSMRDKLHKACISFGKHLKRQGLFYELDKLQELKPKRRYAPVITTVYKDDVRHLLEVNQAWSTSRTNYDITLTHIIVSTLYLTGLRRQELIDLRIEDYNQASRTLTVQSGKGGKGRVLGVNDTLKVSLDAYLLWRPHKRSPVLLQQANGKPLTKNLLVQRISKLSKRAGVKVSAHGFRRGFANLMVEAGLGVPEIQELLGHNDVKTTMKYIHLDKRRLTDRMASAQF